MKSVQLKYENTMKFVGELESIKRECALLPNGNFTFYITWKEGGSRLSEVTSGIEKVFPGSIYYGNEASGSIYNGNLSYDIVIDVNIFEDRGTAAKLVWVEQGTDVSSLEDLWNICRNEEGLKAVELIPSIKYLDVLNMDNSAVDLGDDIFVFGGASVNYDSSTFEAGILANGHPDTQDGMAAILYFGNNLKIMRSYILGWKGIGRLMRIGRSEGKVIYELDGQAPKDVYDHYLGEIGEDRDNLVFPLLVREDGKDFIRTPQAFLNDKSMRMFANIPEGAYARIAYGDKNTILLTLEQRLSDIYTFVPQAIKAYSCAARRLFWTDQEVHKETMPLQKIAPVNGFYTGGEILRFGNKLRVMNSTLVIVGFREGYAGQARKYAPVTSIKADKSIFTRVTHFVERIVEEQVAQREKLQESKTFTDYFLNTYLSAYYVNLDDMSCQVYKRTEELERVNPIIDNFYDTLIGYIKEHVHPDDLDGLLKILEPEYIKEEVRKGNEITRDFRHTEEYGALVIRVQIIRGADDSHAAMGFQDITQAVREQQKNRKMLEDALEAAKVASRSKTEFLFNMSHDIRTPMNAIVGYANMAEKHLDDKEKLTEILNKQTQASNMLLSLINQVLEVSRIESGNVSLEEKEGDVYFSFFEVKETMLELAKTKDIKLTFEFGNIKDRFVYCDFNRCMRVFVNIISNAVKYTREGGRVKVKCEQIDGAPEGYGLYRYTFEDNGIGMSDEFQKHVFEQFAREQTVTQSGIQGSGLGMAVVKSFVDLMHGTISCRSKLGEGTTFTVDIPLRLQQEENYIDPYTGEVYSNGSSSKPREPVNLRGRKVLLVEDNEMNREIATDILTEAGITVESANDGTVAVRTIEEKGTDYYDFILMDIQMPVMNGYEATAEIRKMPGGDRVPIIALSANAFKEDKEKSLAAGMNSHVAKPINIKALFEELQKLL